MTNALQLVTEALNLGEIFAARPDLLFEDKVAMIEDVILTMPQVDLPTKHWFANGVYGREFRVPAGTLLTGKVHLHDSINMMTEGRVVVFTEQGDVELKAPLTFVSPAGLKRIGIVLEDMAWTTFHRCEATTVEEAEKELVTNTVQEYRLAMNPSIELPEEVEP